ncbi:MAG: CvpA family protein [Desulfovibrionaceae bacterium]|nr:CvpA family protein [Desulfovibrionaceae bacterium]
MQVNYFDIAVLGILLAFGIRGGMRGFVAEMAGLAGLMAGLAAAWSGASRFAEALSAYLPASVAPMAAFALLMVAGMIGVGLIARVLQRVLEVSFAGWVDHLLGLGAGLLKGGLLCVVLAYLAVMLIPRFPPVAGAQTIPRLLDFARRASDVLHLTIPMPL